MADPLITVILPVYNAMPYLPQALQSILAQSEKRLHVLVINDGSTDGSADYLASVNDSRVSVLSQDNLGLVAALNRGLSMLKTPYVARMDADDICDKTRFEKQLFHLEQHPDCVLVGCSANHFGMDSSRAGWPVFMPTRHEEIVSAMLLRKSAIIHATILAHSHVFERIGKYSLEAWPAEDYEMFLRMGLVGKLANLPDVLYSIRLHPKSITANFLMKGQKKYEEVCVHYRKLYRPIVGEGRSNRNSSLFARAVSIAADVRAVYFYRRGIAKVVNGSSIQGLWFLFLSSLFSPWRAWEYMKRRVNAVMRRRNIITGEQF
jgi:glycosyltransferase involved in cell wall biosynthesis